jgi:hypothetical protein
MLRRSKAAVSSVLAAFSLMMVGTPDANAGSKLPDPIKAGVAEKLFRLDCGRSPVALFSHRQNSEDGNPTISTDPR